MSDDAKPRPDLTHPDFRPYWQACQESRLVVQSCADCLTVRWPPRPACRACGAQSITWTEVSGLGFLYSWTTIEHPYHPAFEDEVPYTVGVVELYEPTGIRFLGTILHDDSGLGVGDPCRVEFVRVDRELQLPVWRHVSL
jgi:uncharacterized OB-fold protein